MWDTAPTNLQAWIDTYTFARHGTLTTAQAFHHLTQEGGAYAISAGCCPSWGIAELTPPRLHDSHPAYNKVNFLEATGMFLQAFEEPRADVMALRYDAVDFIRQAIDIAFQELVKLTDTEENQDIRKKLIAKLLSTLETDFEQALGMDPNFDSRVWFQGALQWAQSEEEKRLYLFNAKNLISLWGDGFMGVPDYSSRAWAGLYRTHYRERWRIYFANSGNPSLAHEKIVEAGWQWCLREGSPPDEEVTRARQELSLDELNATLSSLRDSFFGDPRTLYTFVETAEGNTALGYPGHNVGPISRTGLLPHVSLLTWLCNSYPSCDGFAIVNGEGVLLGRRSQRGEGMMRGPMWLLKGWKSW